MSREFDVVIFGASGFTGQFVVEEMAISVEMDSLYKTNNIRWAIAGRNRDKLANVLKEASKNTKLEWCTNVPIILADTDDYKSLVDMCNRTRLIMTVVGPFRFYGEPLVKACIEAATNYVDISGEPQFLESIQLKYNEDAKKKGIYIVGATGWDSIPADVGTTWTKKLFKGDLNAVDIIVSTKAPGGPSINVGTWHSAIYGYAYGNELRPLRQKLYQDPMLKNPKVRSVHRQVARRLLSFVEEVKGNCLPFLGSDKTVVRRSENYKYNVHRERPVQCETYFRVGSWMKGVMVIMAASVFAIMAKFSFGRRLLKRYPGFFSFGFVSTDGVPRELLEKTSFSHTIIGYGWDEKLDDPDEQHDSPPTKKIVTKVSGPDPGYTATASFLVHSGMTIIFDRHHLPEPGVLTPGACFRDSYLIDRLTKRNIKFEVLEQL